MYSFFGVGIAIGIGIENAAVPGSPLFSRRNEAATKESIPIAIPMPTPSIN